MYVILKLYNQSFSCLLVEAYNVCELYALQNWSRRGGQFILTKISPANCWHCSATINTSGKTKRISCITTSIGRHLLRSLWHFPHKERLADKFFWEVCDICHISSTKYGSKPRWAINSECLNSCQIIVQHVSLIFDHQSHVVTKNPATTKIETWYSNLE